jgi:magnesium transporter
MGTAKVTTTRNRRSPSSAAARAERERRRGERARRHGAKAAPQPGEPAEPGDSGKPADARGTLRGWAWSGGRLEKLDSMEAVEAAFRKPASYLWVDVESPTEELLGQLGRCVGLHPLTIEDIVERNQRAKIEENTDDTLHMVMFALLYEAELDVVEVDLVLSPRFLLTSSGPGWDPLKSPHLREGIEHYLKEGPDFVLYAVVDYLVDGYFPVFDKLADQIDDLQDAVIAKPSQKLIEGLLQLRRDLLAIRHAVTPQREIFNQLTTREPGVVRPERIVYFRDIYDHLIRLTDELDSFRELVTGTLDAYLTTVNNNLSEVMKRLTAVTVIVAGMGAIAGVFGMSEAALALSFRPEAEPFWILTALIGAFGVAAWVYFRKIGWI